MKKIAIGLLACALLLTGCSTSMGIDLTTLPVRGGGELMWAYTPGSVDDLEEHADIIVRGILSKPKKELTSKENPDGWGATLYSLEVTAVIKGENAKSGAKVQVGDALPYAEPYRTLKDENGELYLKSVDSFTPSSPGEEYLLFLYYDVVKGSPYLNTYTPTRGKMGRYPVPEDMKIHWSSYLDLLETNQPIALSVQIALDPKYYTDGEPPTAEEMANFSISDLVTPEIAE